MVAMESNHHVLYDMIFSMMDGARTIIQLLSDLATFIWLSLRPNGALAAENCFLRKQLAMYQERKLKPVRPDTPGLYSPPGFVGSPFPE